MKVFVLTAALLLAGTQAGAQDRGYDRGAPPPDTPENVKVAWADVLRVDPIYDRVQTSAPREECDDVPVERHVDNGNKAAGTVLGAIVGGVLGSTVGKGDGRKAATVAGAVVGGAVGNNVAQDGSSYYQGSERRCRTVRDVAEERRVVAYDVQYRYRGDVYMSRLNYDPGDRLRVRVSIEPAE
ncbi:MAG: glycine zipper 2TM domain-containing protein [Dokdonella sp.]